MSERMESFEDFLANVDAVLLSHPFDDNGPIEVEFSNGSNDGPEYANDTTLDLAVQMCLDELVEMRSPDSKQNEAYPFMSHREAYTHLKQKLEDYWDAIKQEDDGSGEYDDEVRLALARLGATVFLAMVEPSVASAAMMQPRDPED